MNGEKQREAARLADGEDGLARLLGAAPEPLPPPGLEEAVWRRLQERRTPRPRGWMVPLAAAAAALALWFVWPRLSSEARVVTLPLASGEVEVRAGAAVARLGAKSRAAIVESGPRVELALEEGEVTVREGDSRTAAMVVSARGQSVWGEGALFTVKVAAAQSWKESGLLVHVHQGSVRVRGSAADLTLRAGRSWSLPVPGPSAPPAPSEAGGHGPGEAPAIRHQPGERVRRGAATRSTVLSSEGSGADDALLSTPPIEVAHPDEVNQGLGRPSTSSGRTGVSVRGEPVEPRPEQPCEPAGGYQRPEELEACISATADGGAREMLRYQLAGLHTRRSQYAEAVHIYDSLSSGSGRYAELSLYEAARLRQRYLADPAGALTSFAEYRRRFPGGTLSPEVDLSLVELHLQSSSVEAALREMNLFLSTYPRSERREEVLLLRANLRRDGGDCERALPDYLELVPSPGARGDDATFFAAYCERATGREEAARARLADYLSGFPAGRHRAEAERLLDFLK